MTNRRWWPLAILVAGLAGCADDPFLIRWDFEPTESLVYALDVDELGVPTAFDVVADMPVVVEDPAVQGSWDFAVDRDDGGMVFLPAAALGVTSEAAIVYHPDMSFDDVTSAPRDTTLYVTDEPVPVELGSVYVIRTREQPDPRGFRRGCSFFAKLEPLEVDLETGWVRFRQDHNPNCNDRDLVSAGD